MTALDLRAPASRYEVAEWPDLADPAERRRLTPAALRALPRLAKAWGLTTDRLGALLGEVPASTWHSWQKKPPRDLGPDRLTRASLLLGIFTALHVLHTNELADQWPTRPNTNALFGGRLPVDVMISGGIPAMVSVRNLLDGRRGGL